MKKSPFPQCRHAGNVRSELTRACNSPKLWGLKIVSSSQCDNCYCRDHIDDDSDLNNRQSPCAFCGPEKPVATATLNNGHSEDGRYFACHHPEHDFASSETCQSCGDYLYPIMTPKTPIDVAKKLMQSPYRHQPAGWSDWDNVRKSFHQLTNEAIRQTPGDFSWTQERGIVIVGGGRYFDSTYVTINVIRRLGCTLPIEVWHLDGEINDHHRLLLQPYDVDFRNADRDPQSQSFRFLNGNWWKGWQLKSCALRYCSFKEVLLLDSDCYPVRNPEYLFDWERFREWGAVFWPDLDMNRGLIKTEAWSVFQVPPLDGLPTESGQILINRETCQRELHLACHFNQHADFVYNIIYGDKDTFPIAWHRLGRRYARMWPSSEFDSVAIKQFDFNGHVAFLHRVHDKFRCNGTLFDGTPQQYQENQYHDHFPLESYWFRGSR